MACNCNKKSTNKYKWTGTTTGPDGEQITLTVVYDSELQAKAKVLRKGGGYAPVPAG